MSTRRFLGLISGTSFDAVDAAVIEIDASARIELLGGLESPIERSLRQKLQQLREPLVNLDLLAEVDSELAERFAETALQCLDQLGLTQADISAIGSHGQTLWHRPTARHGNSLQVGNPAMIAAITGCPVVADFRRADMAHGGQGAPLVPPFHQALFGQSECPRAVLNLGGIANFTLLPGTNNTPVLGFDTGPANALLDEWAEYHSGAPCDLNGELASSGKINTELLQRWLQHPYFQQPAPKSTGREVFHMGGLQPDPLTLEASAADIAATLTELTAVSVAEALQREWPQALPQAEVIAIGGGTRNGYLMQRLGKQLAPARLLSGTELGVDSALIEAAAFAWLAARRIDHLPGNLPSVTGARQTCLLGAIYR